MDAETAQIIVNGVTVLGFFALTGFALWLFWRD